jgi:hypothetical protein
MPSRLAESAGFGMTFSLGELLRQLGVVRLLEPFVVLAIGAGLAQVFKQPETHPEIWRARLATVTGLSWALDGLRWLAKWFELGWRNVVGVFEGEGYLGWIALLLVLAWLVIRV